MVKDTDTDESDATSSGDSSDSGEVFPDDNNSDWYSDEE